MKKYPVEISIAVIAITLSAVLMRILPHPPNVSPIAALALFSGSILMGWGIIVPILAMILSDLFIGFHATIPYVYGSFLLIAGIGYLIRKKMSPLSVGLGSISGSILFFIVTNFGVWATSTMYEKSLYGLFQCYYMGLPFFRNTLLGDVGYVAIFFIGFQILRLLIVLMLPSRLGGKRHVGNTV